MRYIVTALLILLIVPLTAFFRVEPQLQVQENEILVSFVIPEGNHQNADTGMLYLKPQAVDGVIFGDVEYPAETREYDGIPSYTGQVTLRLPYEYQQKLEAPVAVSVIFGHQFCTDTNACLPPETYELSALIPAGGAASGFSTVIYFLLMALMGGLILNVMPCVLPILSIKALNLINLSRDKRDMRLNALSYTAGVMLSFVVLALAVIVLKASGELVGWGFQFQNPSFVIFMVVVILLFALSLFDVFLIKAPGMNSMVKHTSKRGLPGSFFSGVFAVLLATPCTAPLLGVALGFAFSQPAQIILLLFGIVGFGLALPFLLIGFIPAAAKLIPRPGEWMNTFKEAMGFLLLLTVVYLLRSLFFLLGGTNLIKVLFFLIFVSFAGWMYGRATRPIVPLRRQWIGSFFALLVLVGSAVWLLQFDQSHYQVTQGASMQELVGWESFSPELLQQYRDAGEPVFVEFTAEWCLTCKTNDTTTLHTAVVTDFFQEHDIRLLHGDYTRKDPLITQWLQRFGRAGVPLYIYYQPHSQTPVVLPELLNTEMIVSLPVQP
jgi:thiol:disulfide interchange protein DsbD